MFENAAVNDVAGSSQGTVQAEGGDVTYHGRPIEIKDRLNRYRAVDDNIWNNPYRATSNKIRSFYHTKDQEFKCKFILKLLTTVI